MKENQLNWIREKWCVFQTFYAAYEFTHKFVVFLLLIVLRNWEQHSTHNNKRYQTYMWCVTVNTHHCIRNHPNFALKIFLVAYTRSKK